MFIELLVEKAEDVCLKALLIFRAKISYTHNGSISINKVLLQHISTKLADEACLYQSYEACFVLSVSKSCPLYDYILGQNQVQGRLWGLKMRTVSRDT